MRKKATREETIRVTMAMIRVKLQKENFKYPSEEWLRERAIEVVDQYTKENPDEPPVVKILSEQGNEEKE